mgnify:CR=1 FL=1
MIVFELNGNTEGHPVYRELEVANAARQMSFLESMVTASLKMGRPFLSQQIIKALNYHAITCLHVSAGEYRPCAVEVGKYIPPMFWQVQSLMDDMVNMVNRSWIETDPIALASFVLWRLNHIHPFINGNGRTARVTAYYVICMKAGRLLEGSPTLPELLKRERDRYVLALEAADASLLSPSGLDFSQLHSLVDELMQEQLGISNPAARSDEPSL